MWFAMRPVELDFLERAPTRYVVRGRLDAPRHAVWGAFADPSGWKHWWPEVREASYPDHAPPYGVGTRRISTVGSARYDETILAWEPETRWAYRIDRATLPIAKAQLECTELFEAGSGTEVLWTLATERRLLLWLAAPFMQRTLDRLLARALANLDAYLSQAPAEP